LWIEPLAMTQRIHQDYSTAERTARVYFTIAAYRPGLRPNRIAIAGFLQCVV
jgi:hypothetical protein